MTPYFGKGLNASRNGGLGGFQFVGYCEVGKKGCLKLDGVIV
jgi:hypothetical protein